MRWLFPHGPDAFNRALPRARGASCAEASEALEAAADLAAEEELRAQPRIVSKLDQGRIFRRAVVQGRA